MGWFRQLEQCVELPPLLSHTPAGHASDRESFAARECPEELIRRISGSAIIADEGNNALPILILYPCSNDEIFY